MAAKLSGSGGGGYEVEAMNEINVTPFVDVMLVLLIIFMVAAPRRKVYSDCLGWSWTMLIDAKLALRSIASTCWT